MTVEPAPGIEGRMRRSGTLQIRDPSDHAMALRALGLVAATLREGPGWIAGPVPTPDGPILTFELKPGRRAVRARDVPGIALSTAQEVGLEKGTIDFLVDATAWENCEELRRYAMAVGQLTHPPLQRYGSIDKEHPPLHEWIEIAAEFVSSHCDDAWLFIHGTGIRISARELADTIRGVVRANASAQLVAVDGMPRVAASVTGVLWPAVALGCACGDDMTPVPSIMDEAWAKFREHAATLNYAFFEPWSIWQGLISLHHHPRPWLDSIYPRRRPDRSLAGATQSEVSDETVLEPFPRQILGPGHLARLGGTVLPTAVELDAGRVEVTLGDPADWSRIYGRIFPVWSEEPPTAYVEGARLLKPCLLSGDEGIALFRARQT